MNAFNKFDKYGLEHLPSHLLDASMLDEVIKVLGSFEFIQRKCALGLTFSLVGDYQKALVKKGCVTLEGDSNKHVDAYIKTLMEYASAYQQQLINWENEGSELVNFENKPSSVNADDYCLNIIPFARFVDTWSFALARSSNTADNFCAQMGFNNSDNPITTRAAKMVLDRTQNPALLYPEQCRPPYQTTPALVRYLSTTANRQTSISALCLSLDGKVAATSVFDSNSVYLWNTSNGQLIAELKGHQEPVNSMKMTANAKSLITCSADKTLRVWDIESCSLMFIVQGKAALSSIDITPDGKTAACLEGNNSIAVWNIQNQSILNRFQLKYVKDYVNIEPITWKVILCPRGDGLVTTCNDGSVKFWDIKSGEYKLILQEDIPNIPVCVTPDGRFYLYYFDNYLRLWDEESQRHVKKISIEGNSLSCLTMTPDGRVAAVGCPKGIALWDIRKEKYLGFHTGHNGAVRNLELSADASIAISAGDDHRHIINVWQPLQKNNTGTIPRERTINYLLTLQNPSLFITMGENHLALVETKSLNTIWELALDEEPTYAIQSPDTKHVIIGTEEGSIYICNLSFAAITSKISCSTESINSLSITPDGNLITCCSGCKCYLYQLDKQNLVSILDDHENTISANVLLASGKYLVTGARSGGVGPRLWNLSTGQLLKRFEGRTFDLKTIHTTEDGTAIIACHRKLRENEFISIWDIKTGKLLKQFEAHEKDVLCSVLIPNSKRFATSSWEFDIKVWNYQQGELVGLLEGHTQGVTNIIATVDGRYLISSGDDCTIRLWDLENYQQVGIHYEQLLISKMALVESDKKIVYVLRNGEVKSLLLTNTFSNKVWVVPTRLWNYISSTSDSEFSCICPRCHTKINCNKLNLEPNTLLLNKNSENTSSEQQEGSSYQCESCHQTLRLHSFVIDECDSYHIDLPNLNQLKPKEKEKIVETKCNYSIPIPNSFSKMLRDNALSPKTFLSAEIHYIRMCEAYWGKGVNIPNIPLGRFVFFNSVLEINEIIVDSNINRNNMYSFHLITGFLIEEFMDFKKAYDNWQHAFNKRLEAHITFYRMPLSGRGIENMDNLMNRDFNKKIYLNYYHRRKEIQQDLLTAYIKCMSRL